MNLLKEYSLKNMTLKNRMVMPPMCMYTANGDGKVLDFHEVHYSSRAAGGVGLIIVEATGITPNGRITDGDLGIWSDDHIEGLKKVVGKSKAYGSKMGIQISHAGRKCQTSDEFTVAPSPIAYSDDYKVPRELTKDEIKVLIGQFKEAALRADKAGFDLLEVHGAHGYLINQFLSPLTNERTDEYGGNTENRTRFLKEILVAIKEVWPEEKPICLRVSATDYLEDGMDKFEMVKIVNLIKEYVDIIHVSSGGVARARINTFPGYQVSLSEHIKKECNIPTIAVGLISEFELIEDILGNERADLVAMGRALLREPYKLLNLAYDKGVKDIYPEPYVRGFF